MNSVNMGIVISLLLLVNNSSVAEAIKDYDFWDDSAFDDISWTSFRSVGRPTYTTFNPVECVEWCIQMDDCVNFLYNARTKRCDILKMNLILNDKRDDDRIIKSVGTRLYRSLDLSTFDWCNYKFCFYYHPQLNKCWKIHYGTGSAKGGLYSYDNAKKHCENDKHQDVGLTILNEDRHFHQIVLMLENIPVLSPKHPRSMWVGAKIRRLGDNTLALLWEHRTGAKMFRVTQNLTFWHDSKSRTRANHGPWDGCLALVPFPVANPHTFRYNLLDCATELFGVVCESFKPAN